MENLIVNQLVGDLSRDFVAEIAPHELPLFRATSNAFFQDPEELMAKQNPKEDMLGFGQGDIVMLMTPVILTVTQQVVLYLTEQVKKSVQEQGSTLIDENVKKLFKKFRPPEEQKTNLLTKEQLAQVHKVALKKARELKLSDARAKLLADAMLGSLAVA